MVNRSRGFPHRRRDLSALANRARVEVGILDDSEAIAEGINNGGYLDATTDFRHGIQR